LQAYEERGRITDGRQPLLVAELKARDRRSGQETAIRLIPELCYTTGLFGFITACAVATSCCISVVPFQWEKGNFDPPQLPLFSSDLSETQNCKKHY